MVINIKYFYCKNVFFIKKKILVLVYLVRKKFEGESRCCEYN